jgi:hypothetical protein
LYILLQPQQSYVLSVIIAAILLQQWRIKKQTCQLKFASFATSHLPGAKSGRKIGKK